MTGLRNVYRRLHDPWLIFKLHTCIIFEIIWAHFSSVKRAPLHAILTRARLVGLRAWLQRRIEYISLIVYGLVQSKAVRYWWRIVLFVLGLYKGANDTKGLISVGIIFQVLLGRSLVNFRSCISVDFKVPIASGTSPFFLGREAFRQSTVSFQSLFQVSVRLWRFDWALFLEKDIRGLSWWCLHRMFDSVLIRERLLWLFAFESGAWYGDVIRGISIDCIR